MWNIIRWVLTCLAIAMFTLFIVQLAYPQAHVLDDVIHWLQSFTVHQPITQH